jgi:hypothetical protein
MYYTWFGAYPNHMHIIIVKNNLLKKEKENKRKTQQHR